MKPILIPEPKDRARPVEVNLSSGPPARKKRAVSKLARSKSSADATAEVKRAVSGDGDDHAEVVEEAGRVSADS